MIDFLGLNNTIQTRDDNDNFRVGISTRGESIECQWLMNEYQYSYCIPVYVWVSSLGVWVSGEMETGIFYDSNNLRDWWS